MRVAPMLFDPRIRYMRFVDAPRMQIMPRANQAAMYVVQRLLNFITGPKVGVMSILVEHIPRSRYSAWSDVSRGRH